MKSSSESLSDFFLDSLKIYFKSNDITGEDLNTCRLALGRSLSVIHIMLLSACDTDEERSEVGNLCVDTISRLIGCTKDSLEHFKVNGVAIVSETFKNEEYFRSEIN